MRLFILTTVLAASMGLSSTANAANIVQTAKSAGVFNTLLTAAKKAGLAGALSSGGPLTVFAPTDAAFAKLPKGTVANLLKPKNKHKLAALLKYHVVPRRILSKNLPHKAIHVRTIKSSGDRTIRVKRSGKSVRVDRARVIKTDVRASNGVIHVINRVLLPSR